ncbi:MAG: CapA family protein [Eubacteriales bacterium]|nr:CapA family protein [Eubacteriales bacterium]
MARNDNSGGGIKLLLVLLILVMIAATGLVVWLCIDLVDRPVAPTQPPAQSLPQPTAAPTTEAPQPQAEPETVVSTVTVASMGDLVMHMPVVNTTRQADGSYDFESVFRYVKPYIEGYDYALANLETTLAGTSVPYHGDPLFNSPDSLVDGVKAAGFDMLLTANNHASDTHTAGILRTVEQVRQRGLTALGTQLSDEEPKYVIADVGGVKIGMACYTYATGQAAEGRPRLNGNAPVEKNGIVNYFLPKTPEKFYTEVEALLKTMKDQGADTTMLFLHWGIEYQTTEKPQQREMAQKLCDLGVDVIVGSHPHVVEPVALVESTVDPGHKTVVIYSLGNAVSNQRTGVSHLFPDGYTEDGAIFTVTFEKYSDGKVYLADADVIPTWVNLRTNQENKKEYNILPLDKTREEEWQSLYSLTDEALEQAKKSYDRTDGIVSQGVQACKDHLTQSKAAREQMYLEQASGNPS